MFTAICVYHRSRLDTLTNTTMRWLRGVCAYLRRRYILYGFESPTDIAYSKGRRVGKADREVDSNGTQFQTKPTRSSHTANRPLRCIQCFGSRSRHYHRCHASNPLRYPAAGVCRICQRRKQAQRRPRTPLLFELPTGEC
jgi:hypothetical protein